MSRSKRGRDAANMAVALQYGAGDAAPVVVASGMGYMAEKIIETAVGVGEKLWKANGIRVGNDFDKWNVRHSLQAEACMELDYFLYLICLARTLYHLRSGKYRYWVKLARETRDLARAWRDSDSRRYGGLKSGT